MAGPLDDSRELSLGLDCFERGLIDRESLASAIRSWALSPGRTMAEILAGGLVEPGTLERLRRRAEGSEAEATIAYPLASASPDPASTTKPAPPRFRVIRQHARGGLGEVFLAFDEEVRRQVAVKELRPHRADDPAARARFLVEAEVTGRLEHPGIVPVYSLGKHPDGRPYYAMRLIEGQTLRAAIDDLHQGTRDPEGRELAFRRLLRAVIDCCNAVAFAHSRGVVHRDLKPENIMLGPFGETLVVDWGLAKLLTEAGEDGEGPETVDPRASDPSMTMPGAVIGTPRYMSPEQAAGDLARVGPASDVYGLGAILYCVLTGRDPFPGDELQAVLDRVRRGIFPAPRRISRAIDPALDAICLRAMALDPRARHATALDLAGELEAWLAAVRFRGEQERAVTQLRGTLARLGLERARSCFERKATAEGMLWLARALEDAPAEPPELSRLIRTSLAGWHATKRLSRRLKHGGTVRAIGFCPDGRRLAAASDDGTARLWDVATGSALCPPLRHPGPAVAVAFRPSGDLIATGCEDGFLRRWDALTGDPIGRPLAAGGPVARLEFGPDGARLAATVSGTGSDAPLLWDVESGEPVGSHRGALAIAFRPDGSRVAAAFPDGAVHLLNAETGEATTDPLRHEAAPTALAFDPVGGRLLVGTKDRQVTLWDLADGAAIARVLLEGEPSAVAFHPDGRCFATAAGEGSARLWDPRTGRPIGARLDHKAAVDRLAFAPDGSLIATGGRDGTVRLWCASTGLPIGPPLDQRAAVTGLAFGRDGARLASIGPDATVQCWTVPPPICGGVEQVACWVRVTTGLDFDEGDAIRKLEGPAGWDLRRRLDELGGAPCR